MDMMNSKTARNISMDLRYWSFGRFLLSHEYCGCCFLPHFQYCSGGCWSHSPSYYFLGSLLPFELTASYFALVASEPFDTIPV